MTPKDSFQDGKDVESRVLGVVSSITGKYAYRIAIKGRNFRAVVIDDAHALISTEHHVHQISLKDGSIEWTWDRPKSHHSLGVGDSNPHQTGERLYIPSNNHLSAIDLPQRKVLWTFHAPERLSGTPLSTGNSVVFRCDDGYLYSLAAADGRSQWRTKLGQSFKLTGNLFADERGLIYCGGVSGQLYAVDRDKGSIRFFTDLDGPIDSFLGVILNQLCVSTDTAAYCIEMP